MARISHANCNHPETPAGRRQCRADRAFAQVTVASQTPIVTPVIPTVAPFSFKRIDGESVGIIHLGQPVGRIVRRTRTEQALIPGTRLARAGGRKVTAYHVELFSTNFPGAVREQLIDRCGWSRLALAKRDAMSRVEALRG